MRSRCPAAAAALLACTYLSANQPVAADDHVTEPVPDVAAIPESLSPAAMNALVEKLNPDQVDALGNLMELLGRSADLDALESTAGATGTTQGIKIALAGFQERVVSSIAGVPDLLGGIAEGLAAIFDGRGAGGSALFLGTVLLVLAVGAGGEWLFKRATADRRGSIVAAKPEALGETLRTLGLRVLLELGCAIAFVLAALIANHLVVSDAADRALIAAFVLQAILIVRIAATLLRFVLAPKRPDLRLVFANDWTAKFMYRSFVLIAGVIGASFFLATVLESNQIVVTEVLRFWVGLVISAWLIYTVWKARAGMTSILTGGEENLTPGLQKMAAWWPWVTIVIIGLHWLLLQIVLSTGTEALPPERTALALALIVAAPFLDTMIRGLVTHLVPPMHGEGAVAEAAYEDTKLSYLRVGRVALLTVLVIAVGKLWGLSLRDLPDEGMGAAIAANGVGFLLILAVGYLAWEVLNLWVNRKLAADVPQGDAHAEGAEMGGGGGSRIATILPILHMTLQVTIITLTVLLGLSQLGVNITPLLAGAGVFGLAIGFGAQALVKDIVSGVFFLMDDAFRVGEFIDIGGTMGTVEKIRIRSLQLRGHTGAVHIVPYGDMSKLTNLSRDWVIMKLRFTVPFDTDLDKVRKLFKKIGQELMQNPEHAENLLEPFKSQGAGDVTDVGIVVRGKFTAKPGTQFPIRKEIYSRVQKAFEENGIEFARREVRVQMPESPAGAQLDAVQKAAVTSAVGQAVVSADAEGPATAPAAVER